MRIAIFTESYEPVVNGVSVSVRTLVDGLVARGHDVHVFASWFRGYVDASDKVYRFPALHCRFNPDYPFPAPHSGRLKRVFEDLKPDIVHTQTPYFLGMAGMRWAKHLGVPLVSTNHTLYLEYAHYVPVVPQALTKTALSLLMRRYYAACSAIVVPSTATERCLRSMGIKTRVEVIPTGVVPEHFKFPHLRDKVRSDLGIDKDAVVLLYVGRVALEKNIRMLLESFASVAQGANNIHLVVVGGGPYEAEARAFACSLKIDSRVTFTGMKSHCELGPYYSAGDVFVFPSATDTQGIALIEAMVAGLPCAVVKSGGCPEMVDDGVSGLVVDNDKESYAAALEMLVSNTDLRLRLAQGAMERGRGYTVDAMAGKMESFYRSVLKPHAGVEPMDSTSAVSKQNSQLNVKG